MGKTLIRFWIRSRGEDVSATRSITGLNLLEQSLQLFCKVVSVFFAVLWCQTLHKCRSWKCGSDAGGRITADQAERSWICVVLLQQTGPALLDNLQGLSVQIWHNYPTPKSATNHWENSPRGRLGKAWNFRIKIRNNTNFLFEFTHKKSSKGAEMLAALRKVEGGMLSTWNLILVIPKSNI